MSLCGSKNIGVVMKGKIQSSYSGYLMAPTRFRRHPLSMRIRNSAAWIGFVFVKYCCRPVISCTCQIRTQSAVDFFETQFMKIIVKKNMWFLSNTAIHRSAESIETPGGFKPSTVPGSGYCIFEKDCTIYVTKRKGSWHWQSVHTPLSMNDKTLQRWSP